MVIVLLGLLVMLEGVERVIGLEGLSLRSALFPC